MTNWHNGIFRTGAKGIRFQIPGFHASLPAGRHSAQRLVSVFAALRSSLAAGLLDQAIVSFGNFGLNIALARMLPLHDYGVLSVVLSFMLFLNTLHAALVGYPLSVHSAPANRRAHGKFLSTAFILTVLCAPVCLAVLGGALAGMKHLALLPFAGAALLLWQIQEVYRRSALARASNTTAIFTDAVRYLGALAAIVALRSAISMDRALVLIGVASAFAAMPMLNNLRHGMTTALGNITREIAIHWRLAAPVLGANVLVALSTQWFLWLIAWHQSPENSGALVALANIAAISSPVMFGVENIMVPEIARRRESLSFNELKRLLGMRIGICGLLLAPLFTAIAVFPEAAIRLFYGAHSPFVHETLPLRLMILAYASYMVSFIMSATLRGYRSGSSVFLMQFYPAMLGITLGSWLTVEYGLTGACAASLLAGLLRAALGMHFVLGLRAATQSPRTSSMALGTSPP